MDAHESPASSHETGSLTQASPHESRFIGSSSGIYFIKTVKQAFDSAGCQQGHLPPVESTVGGEEDFADPSARNSPERGHGFEVNVNQGAIEINNATQLGTIPPYEKAQRYAIEYFKTWHPVLPFISGPEFLQELEALYSDPGITNGVGRMTVDRHRLCYLIVIQCVLSIGTSAVPATTLLRSNLLSLTAALASRHDILTIQAILAAQTYCVSTMALRTASSLGGLLSKLIYHAGLHRCPYRYPQLSDEDRELRKRILWSAYALDRYISQALGIPVSLTNHEIDVCVPGRTETHGKDAEHAHSIHVDGLNGNSKESKINREIILSNFVDHANLVGTALELFHVSLHSRSNDPKKILFLRSDVDKWFNGLPEEPRLTPESSAAEEQVARFLPFFHVLYEQLVISINRPSLSLPRSAPEFHHGLQVTIRAAKRTILAMERQTSLFWPGYLAAVWMSGLIISFACQIGLYSIGQGSQEIHRCLSLLKRMSERWRSAQRCHAVLSTLLYDLQHPQRRIASDAFGEIDQESGRPVKQRVIDPALAGTAVDAHASPGATSETSPGSLPLTTTLGNGPPMVPMTFDGMNQWDVNDFFQDLSWNNLFDINNMGQDPGMQLYSG